MGKFRFSLRIGDENGGISIKKEYQNVESFKAGLKHSLQRLGNDRPINIVFEEKYGNAIKNYDLKKNVLTVPPFTAEYIPSLINRDQKIKFWDYQGSGSKIWTAIENLSEDLFDLGIKNLLVMSLIEDIDEYFSMYAHWAYDPDVLFKAEARAELMEHDLDCVFNDEFDIEEYQD